MPTILITGCSTGFGLETARLFLDRGWTVVATMRDPQANKLAPSPNLRVLPLDVTDEASIANALAEAGTIDVLVNNAGIGWVNALEGTSTEVIRRLFETNTFGTMAMARAVLPSMRERGSGTIINVTSSVTLKPLPLFTAYTASKAAVNAMTAVLAGEVAQFGIRAITVMPGQSPETAFADNVAGKIQEEGGFAAPYMEMVEQVLARHARLDPNETTRPLDVAEVIWRAATDPQCPGEIPAGVDAVAWAAEIAA
ncbi:MAG: SDR family oxidoreductase [Sphingomonadaceae bacterium]|nr:SDR family oxidoreductase [Sphingomonadaceae bacterium]MCP5383714.1 SDR family oxidoreductase [Altererythrobacter sp.]MCP5391320.1 SDR family oxidoreductase [Sphingomonadaceae bacterium]MCP5394952.1 SDR family oxidoreductase [Sphingomonadaceae bacterium]